MTKPVYKPFDATRVPLKGSNLIEASAGTGKTYSIAIMVLRLVMEQKIPVKEILMVTFTKAAVAELEERVRLFIRKAFRVANGDDCEDPTIRELVGSCMKKYAVEVRQRLKEAVLFLDETSVLTIHSFCQQSLNEFAFETGQVFHPNAIQDTSELRAEQLNQFWRSHITTLPVELLALLKEIGFSRAGLDNILKEHFDGKQFSRFDPRTRYECDSIQQEKWISEIRELKKAVEELRNCLEKKIEDEKDHWRSVCEKNRYAKKALELLNDNDLSFIEFIEEKIASGEPPKYIVNCFEDIIKELELCDEAYLKVVDQLTEVVHHFYCMAIQMATEGIQQVKDRYSLLSFDDMILKFHDAIVHGDKRESLKAKLRQKYKAVFVDEFQDTDKAQFEIFDQAFGQDTLLFYIGDPKQSIYAWRKADIFTYFEARRSVQHVYEMNLNYRSSASLIKAMNAFFSIEDPFCFGNDEDAIQYFAVDSPPGNDKGALVEKNEEAVPVSIYECPNKDSICEAVVAQVAALLDSGEYEINRNGIKRKILPSDIGILVRSNREGATVRQALTKFGIPAITIGDQKVLQSEEAVLVLYLLQAMLVPNRGNINRALLNDLTGFTSADILCLVEEKALQVFNECKRAWEENGVYTALMKFISGFNVRTRLLGGHAENGERIIANIFHLAELLHKIQSRKNFSPLELIAWLQRGIDGMETEGDEYEQRMENDEDAVKIITIHKSKGLQYNIVLAPYLDFVPNEKSATVSFRSREGHYVSMERSMMTDDEKNLLKTQNEQENRRLVYVAITRAVYTCFIYKNTYRDYSNSSLATFIKEMDREEEGLISFEPVKAIPARYQFSGKQNYEAGKGVLKAGDFLLLQSNWRKWSFSSLAVKPEPVVRPFVLPSIQDYDRFVFQQLEKGAHTGNLLHDIFESIDFSGEEGWKEVVEEIVSAYAPRKKEDYVPMILRMLKEVLHAKINDGMESFSMNEVAGSERLHEFEFDFILPSFSPNALNTLATGTSAIRVKDIAEAEGVMNGKMDLFFRCRGKYYVLDWKSNYLGGSIKDYSPGNLDNAMNEGNYHLQYLVYTYAAKKYLESRLGENFNYEEDFGGVIYMFVRGIRVEGNTGIYLCKPGMAQMNQMDELLNQRPSGVKKLSLAG